MPRSPSRSPARRKRHSRSRSRSGSRERDRQRGREGERERGQLHTHRDHNNHHSDSHGHHRRDDDDRRHHHEGHHHRHHHHHHQEKSHREEGGRGEGDRQRERDSDRERDREREKKLSHSQEKDEDKHHEREREKRKQEETQGEQQQHRHTHTHTHTHKQHKQQKRSISLSFGEEMEEEEAGAVDKASLKNIEEATNQRIKAERLEAMRKLASSSSTSSSSSGILGGEAATATTSTLHPHSSSSFPSAAVASDSPRGRSESLSLLVVDDEPEDPLPSLNGHHPSSSSSPSNNTTAPIHCLAKSAANRGPKAEMEDTHTIVASLPAIPAGPAGGNRQEKEKEGGERREGSASSSSVPVGGGDDDAHPVACYGVYDGHCGSLAAEIASTHLHTFLSPFRDAFLGRPGESGEERERRAKAALMHAYAETEALILKTLIEEGHRQDGAAAVTAVVAKQHVYVANAGDCRCVLATQTTEGIDATRLSLDHKPQLEEEKARILRAGGNVELSGVWRVAHNMIPMRLAVSRAFGDPMFKRNLGKGGPSSLLLHLRGGALAAMGMGRPPPTGFVGRAGLGPEKEKEKEKKKEGEVEEKEAFEPLVSPVPYVGCHTLKVDDLFMVLASDGIFDVMTDGECVRYVGDVFARHAVGGGGGGGSFRKGVPFRPTELAVKEAADLLITIALQRGAYDNLTVIVVCFQR